VASFRGYNVILSQTNERFAREKSSIGTMLSNQIDDFLVSFTKKTTEFDHFLKLLDYDCPIVFFDRIPNVPNAISVMVDDYHSAYKATSHPISQGYAKILQLVGSRSRNK